ncbi:hypothetical protein SLEP1_g42436 [Rubroshorea leprosula]|uniref:Lipoxygenase domain-containing protein n=1 Tax=Rubroshorea leprosula TaxID=152421 RepID=A0AAV5LA22_9ROSI|nr:hypothetical protein SLEP1_g42436 [Rubroshorea leprosula]
MSKRIIIFWCSWLQKQLRTRQHDSTSDNQKSTINGEIVISHGPDWLPHFGQKLASVQIYGNIVTDASAFGQELLSDKAFLRNGRRKTQNNLKTTIYKFKVKVVREFDTPGASRIENRCHREFFLEYATLSIPNKKARHSPRLQIMDIPHQEDESFRVIFPRKRLWVKGISGNPDKGLCYARLVLGSPEYSYPRRLKAGRSHCKQDHSIVTRPETNSIGTYIPPDERLSPERLLELKANLIKAIVYFLVPAEETRITNRIVELTAQYFSCLNMPIRKLLAKRSLRHQDSGSFKSFDDIVNMFSDRRRKPAEVVKDKLKKWIPNELYKEIVRASKREVENLPLPPIIAERMN